jgi:CDP-glucose 4,6-dehydratase
LRGAAFNFSNETPLSVREVVDRIRAVMGSELEPVVLNEASGEIKEQWLSSAKARSSLGWEPLYSLDEGLRRTVEWYRGFFRRDA